MCYFVFVGVPVCTLPVLIDALGFESSTVNAPSLRSIFPPQDVVTEIRNNQCSCGLYAPRTTMSFDAKKRARYRAKGWSASKIERALAIGGVHAKAPNPRELFRDAIAGFVGSTGSLRIFAHWFKGSTETETIVARRVDTLTLADYLARDGTYDEDVLYDLRA